MICVLSHRRRKRLYRKARAAYREGLAEQAREAELQRDDMPVPPEPMATRPHSNPYAAAWYAGYREARPLSHAMVGPLPTRVWADVLAEALRP